MFAEDAGELTDIVVPDAPWAAFEGIWEGGALGDGYSHQYVMFNEKMVPDDRIFCGPLTVSPGEVKVTVSDAATNWGEVTLHALQDGWLRATQKLYTPEGRGKVKAEETVTYLHPVKKNRWEGKTLQQWFDDTYDVLPSTDGVVAHTCSANAHWSSGDRTSKEGSEGK